ncbi:NlpC/P60 family protein [Rhodococcus sp. IEGM 1408]|uniref:NlpC/P60 family protein n=1 Tax=Rhodococcus sp. IEGM 1408 TaxID=3082220 RepID=UPI002954201B|nr:NlpC/P60 family protein [Rhodococcus sp. IEGM 1408]MDV8001875.1 NlpC/P60 family protein [Rhodococcus sp. IEGM 1408]
MTRSVRAVAIVAAAGAVLSAGVAAASAQDPDPAPTTTSWAAVDSPDASAGEDLTELTRLSDEAGALGEELHLARAELAVAHAERDRRERDAGVAAGRAALAHNNASRDQSLVDHLATRRYRIGETGGVRAAALAESPRDLVDRLGTLQRLSGATTSALDASRAASAEAARLRDDAALASEAARTSAGDAQHRADELDRRSEEMRMRIDEVRRRVDALSDAQRARWAGGPVMPPGYVAPPVDSVNSAALRVALSRLGAPYSWGATGPSEFDCSGLMVWSYAREGKTLPRSSQAQAVSGAPVAMADVQPGDLVIYNPGATHVGMYAGDGLVLHAPTYGVPVKLERVDAMPIDGIRRY